MDISDQATERETQFLESARDVRKPVLTPCGGCYSCGENVDDNRLFCNPDCRDDYERTQRALDRNGKPALARR